MEGPKNRSTVMAVVKQGIKDTLAIMAGIRSFIPG